MKHPLCCTTLVLSLSSLLVACGDDGDPAASTTTQGQGGSGAASTGGQGGQGAAGGGATGGSGGLPLGEPIDAPPDQWTWVDFPESRCINDTPTGIGVNPHATSDDVVIFLMGGNACFNGLSCSITANTNGYGADKFGSEGALSSAVFDRTNAENPLRDYSYVFVPYCTGDVHAGNNDAVEVGGATRTFKGFHNMAHYLSRIVPTFPGAERVIIAGVSAGGFGAAYNFDHVARAFPAADVALIDDSGPPMGAEFLTPCLQSHMRETWGLSGTLPTDCAGCDTATGQFAEEYVQFILGKYPTSSMMLISSKQDSTIAAFWGFGNNDCANLQSPLPQSYPGSKFEDGLYDIRDRMIGDATNMKLYLPDGSSHVWLDDPPWTTVEEGVNLGAWIEQGLAKDAAWDHVPPAP